MNENTLPMPPRSSLKRSQKPIKARKKPLVRIGKVSGCVRLSWGCSGGFAGSRVRP